ncbi:hypothetical protein E2562_025483 [Oryza meyeriana var. granulata]|uniref:Uncharacterized protein n=1 Tax=Oryza meyeriana var. granulata TaxID=110450 RepID=A0A6G1CIR7_9ORYZ|nr:hypothetical protein E2562_025483 [Oryza meyeriana var. granulata]
MSAARAGELAPYPGRGVGAGGGGRERQRAGRSGSVQQWPTADRRRQRRTGEVERAVEALGRTVFYKSSSSPLSFIHQGESLISEQVSAKPSTIAWISTGEYNGFTTARVWLELIATFSFTRFFSVSGLNYSCDRSSSKNFNLFLELVAPSR